MTTVLLVSRVAEEGDGEEFAFLLLGQLLLDHIVQLDGNFVSVSRSQGLLGEGGEELTTAAPCE